MRLQEGAGLVPGPCGSKIDDSRIDERTSLEGGGNAVIPGR